MVKIFYMDNGKFTTSNDAVTHILTNYFNLKNPTILKNENGKPYLQNNPLYFSVSHTVSHTFIAVSSAVIGIDAERLSRKVDYQKVIKKFPDSERQFIKNTKDFLTFWTIKESVIKYLGGSIARDLKKIEYNNNTLFYNALPLSVHLSTKTVEGHILTVCSPTNDESIITYLK